MVRSPSTTVMDLARLPVRFYQFCWTKRIETRLPAPPDIVISTHILFIVAPVIALFFVPLTGRAVCSLLLMNIIGIIGSEVANHRYFSHRSFRTSRWFEAFLGLCSALVLQDSAFHWATDHRFHHRYSDHRAEFRDLDPYNSTKGFWYSFYGWVLETNKYRHDMEGKRNRGKYLYESELLNSYQYYPRVLLYMSFILVGLYLFGGISGIVYGMVGLIGLPSLDMALLNSVGHGHGLSVLHGRTYETNDTSRNVALLAFLGSGVGWHNNHHAFPSSARAGFRWWQLDKAWLLIRLMERLGLVWDVKTPSAEQWKSQVKSQQQPCIVEAQTASEPRVPVAGAESARKVLDPALPSNELIHRVEHRT